jgi:hypothetical protein
VKNQVSYGRKKIASRMSEELAAAGRNGNQDPRALLKQSLATRLRDEILQGRIAPGQKIIEARWARHFGVAQFPFVKHSIFLPQKDLSQNGTGEVHVFSV